MTPWRRPAADRPPPAAGPPSPRSRARGRGAQSRSRRCGGTDGSAPAGSRAAGLGPLANPGRGNVPTGRRERERDTRIYISYIYNWGVFPRWPQSMGCAPSIHISDSRVVYHSSKESEECHSPHQTNTTMSQQQQGNPVPGLFIKSSNTSTYKVRTNSSKKDKRENSQSMEAETQTSRSSVKVKGCGPRALFLPLKSHTAGQLILLELSAFV